MYWMSWESASCVLGASLEATTSSVVSVSAAELVIVSDCLEQPATTKMINKGRIMENVRGSIGLKDEIS